MRLQLWAAAHALTQALPVALLARSGRLRRLQRWVLYRYVFAAADAMRSLGKR